MPDDEMNFDADYYFLHWLVSQEGEGYKRQFLQQYGHLDLTTQRTLYLNEMVKIWARLHGWGCKEKRLVLEGPLACSVPLTLKPDDPTENVID